jgi:hypothetical protein
MMARTRRAISATVIGLGLLAAALLAAVMFILGFVDATAMIEDSKRCAPTIWQLQWPKYTGCTMAAHEGLAAGLIGAAGAIWAAVLAYIAIQHQIAAERRAREQQQHDQIKRQRQQQSDAKRAAIACIKPTILAAATAMFMIDRAFGKRTEEMAARVKNNLAHMNVTLGSFTIREFVRDLGPDDRIIYLEIVGLLSTLLSIHTFGQSKAGVERYKVERSALTRVYELLKTFDTDLAREFAAASEVVSPPES